MGERPVAGELRLHLDNSFEAGFEQRA